MLEEILREELPGSRMYRDLILQQGGVAAVSQELLKHIDEHIRDLQGRSITTETLSMVKEKQGTEWLRSKESCGYYALVTDDRNLAYLRSYVGQTKCARRRILYGHIQSNLQGDYTTLFYFIVWLGNGHRTLTFLRLWSPLSEEDSIWRQVKFNLLESLFCKVFESHHGSLSRNGAPILGGFGLNIISPLMQNTHLSEIDRGFWTNQLRGSSDPQIKAFFSFRVQTKQRVLSQSSRSIWIAADYFKALDDAIKDRPLFSAVEATLQSNISHTTDSGLYDDIPFYGTRSASIGFVLDIASTIGGDPHNDYEANAGDSRQSISCSLPWALEAAKFNAENVLVWTHNFKRFSIISTSILEGNKDEEVIHARQHLELLNTSSLKVVILCGSMAKRTILSLLKISQRYDLKLRGFCYQLYIENTSKASRLFIVSPGLPAKTWSLPYLQTAKVCELIKFVSLVTNTKGITAYFIENASVLHIILKQRQREKDGAAKMTVDNIHSALYSWLCRKGFGDLEDIRRLEEIAGSLMQGLCILLHVLPRKPKILPSKVQLKRREHVSHAPIACEHASAAIKTQAEQLIKSVLELQNSKYHEKILISTQVATETQPPPISNEEEFYRAGYNTTQESLSKNLKRAHPNESESTQKGLSPPIDKRSRPNKASTTQNGSANIADIISAPFRYYEISPDVDDLDLERGSQPEASSDTIAEFDDAPQLYPTILGEIHDHCVSVRFGDSRFQQQDEKELNGVYGDEAEAKALGHYQNPENCGLLLQKGRRKTTHVNDWSLEHLRFRGKSYPYYLDPSKERRMRIGHCHMILPRHMDIGDGCISLFIEVADEASRHPSLYAIDATEVDLGRRLSFRVEGKDRHGKKYICHPQQGGLRAVFKANSFLDKLLYSTDNEELVATPRRFVRYSKNSAPEFLRDFEGGGNYTSPVENGQIMEEDNYEVLEEIE